MWAPEADYSWQQKKPIKFSAALALSHSLTSLPREKHQPHLWFQLSQGRLRGGDANSLSKVRRAARIRSDMEGKALIFKASSSNSFLLICSNFSRALCLPYRIMFATRDKYWDLSSNRFLKRRWEAMIFPLHSPKPSIFTSISYYLGFLAKHKLPYEWPSFLMQYSP